MLSPFNVIMILTLEWRGLGGGRELRENRRVAEWRPEGSTPKALVLRSCMLAEG